MDFLIFFGSTAGNNEDAAVGGQATLAYALQLDEIAAQHRRFHPALKCQAANFLQFGRRAAKREV